MREHAPALLGRHQRALGRLALRRRRRDRDAARTCSSTPTRTRVATAPTSRPTRSLIGLDDPAAPPAAQPRGPPLHAAGRRRVGGTTSAPSVTELLDAVASERRRGRRSSQDLAAPLPAMMIGQAARVRRRALARPPGAGPSGRSPSAAGPRTCDEDGMLAAMEFAGRRPNCTTAKQRVPGRRRHVGVDHGRDRRLSRSGSTRSSPTRSSCSTAAPRRPAR